MATLAARCAVARKPPNLTRPELEAAAARWQIKSMLWESTQPQFDGEGVECESGGAVRDKLAPHCHRRRYQSPLHRLSHPSAATQGAAAANTRSEHEALSGGGKSGEFADIAEG